MYPTMDAYQIAMQAHQYSLKDDMLKTCTIKTNSWGLPLVQSGGFALTYCLQNGGKKWAVRCFHKERTDLYDRYERLNSFLKVNKNPYFVGFHYQKDGIAVNHKDYPIVKMDWVDGIPINTYVEDNLDKSGVLLNLAQQFKKCANEMAKMQIAHGDLQTGNILICDGQIKLIDYDGIFVPKMNYDYNFEIGHINFQHPLRDNRKTGIHIDRFSLIVIYLALLFLGHCSSKAEDVWEKYNTGENLLFVRNDFIHWDKSPLMRDMKSLLPDKYHSLLDNFASICHSGFEDIPPLEDFLLGKETAQVFEFVDTKILESAKRRQYTVIDALDSKTFLENVGNVVEAVGYVTDIKHGHTKYKKPYVFINFARYNPYKKDFYIVIWSEGLSYLRKHNIKPEDYVHQWVSATGLIDTFKGRPSLAYSETVKIRILQGEQEAKEILKGEEQSETPSADTGSYFETDTGTREEKKIQSESSWAGVPKVDPISKKNKELLERICGKPAQAQSSSIQAHSSSPPASPVKSSSSMPASPSSSPLKPAETKPWQQAAASYNPQKPPDPPADNSNKHDNFLSKLKGAIFNWFQ